ncbi:hypothetical protein [Luteolibacter sp. AS25]|uniref:hypothetical protein n=1 Tax=Luteolibacter sp. AS25 TaxID=3135776 RepID=UPI00398B0019
MTITEDHIDFCGRYDHFVLDSVDDLSFGTVGFDLMNRWVKVKCGDLEVCFADGGWMGWRDKFTKSTRKILRAIIDKYPEDEESNHQMKKQNKAEMATPRKPSDQI